MCASARGPPARRPARLPVLARAPVAGYLGIPRFECPTPRCPRRGCPGRPPLRPFPADEPAKLRLLRALPDDEALTSTPPPPPPPPPHLAADGFPEAAKLDGAFPEYGPKGRRIRKDKGKKKRGMSAYNLFLRETILHLKTTQAHKYKDQPKIAFKDAVAMWKDVSPSRKDEYAARIKDMFGDTAGQTIEGTATKKRKGGRR